MPRGKLAAQAAHAAVKAVQKSHASKVKAWDKEGAKKVALQVPNKLQLFKLVAKAKLKGLTTATIRDAGKTIFKSPTITCAAIGPDLEKNVDKITKELKLL